MSYTATVNDPHQPDAMPMWESLDHATVDDAYRAAQTHIQATQPDDRIVDQGHGVYVVWTVADAELAIQSPPSSSHPVAMFTPTRRDDRTS